MSVHPLIHVVDDEAPVRTALVMLAESAGHHAQAHASAEDFLKNAGQGASGCVVADVRMPGMSGLELQTEMKRRGMELPMIVITGHGDVAMAVQALKAGALGFLEKPFDDDVFLASVSEALEAFDRHDRERRAMADVEARVDALTQREREIMTLIAQGLSNREAARDLSISVRTVENHRARVMEKMQAKNLSDLVRMVLRLEDASAH